MRPQDQPEIQVRDTTPGARQPRSLQGVFIMQKILSTLAIGTALVFGLAAHAEEKAKSPQQNKMAMCNKDAVGKKGDERKAFMKTCLSAKKDAQPAKS
jgi:psiF repeat